MRLTELEPKWLTPDMFIFRSPTGNQDWLTCKRIIMPMREQYDIIYGSKDAEDRRTGEFVGQPVVTSTPDCAWHFEGNDFETLTVFPSIDASKSGNWHGFITNGEIVGGI